MLRQLFSILIIRIPSLGSGEVPQQIWPGRFSRFYVYRLKTNRKACKLYTKDVYIKYNKDVYRNTSLV